MIDEKDMGALVNQIHEVTRDHIDWIKSQLLKPNNFMVAKGREVWIDVPNSNLKNIVTIPNKNEENYRTAWIKVYNLAINYLEGRLSYAYMKGDLDYKTINWPEFKAESADYARGLEKILDEQEKNLNKKEVESELLVSKSVVQLEPVNTEDYEEEVRVENTLEEDITPFTIQKILDGDRLTAKDIRGLQNDSVNMVVLPCQNVLDIKEEKLFFENMRLCEEEGINTGVMIYGKATDEAEAEFELKKLFKMLEQCGENFMGSVIYEVNDEFVSKNKDKEMGLLSFINSYNMIAEGLETAGFMPIISMNLESRNVLQDIYTRYNLNSKYEIVYMVLVREADELDKNDSYILMDPQYDYDVITFRNPNFQNSSMISDVLNREKNTALARAA